MHSEDCIENFCSKVSLESILASDTSLYVLCNVVPTLNRSVKVFIGALQDDVIVMSM